MVLIFFVSLMGLLTGIKGITVDVVGQVWDVGCQLDQNTERIQVAFAVDTTYTNKAFVEKLSESLKHIMDELNKIHPGTEFALTTHANWPQSAFTSDGTGLGHEMPEGCYTKHHEFTNSYQKIQEAASNVTYLIGPTVENSEENAVAAVAFTAADEGLGWVRDIFDPNGKRVHRFVVLITDEWSIFELPIEGDRKPFRGDGTDTCSTSLPPSLEKTRAILDEKDVNMIGLYFTNQTVSDKYVEEFTLASFGYRHCFRKRVFTISGFPNSGHITIRNCVRQFMRCVFLDPPGGYNTLGL